MLFCLAMSCLMDLLSELFWILHEIIVFILSGSANRKFGLCWSQKRCDCRMGNLFWRTEGWKIHSGVPKKKTGVLKAGSTVDMCGLGTNFKSCRWVFHIFIFLHFSRLVAQRLLVWSLEHILVFQRRRLEYWRLEVRLICVAEGLTSNLVGECFTFSSIYIFLGWLPSVHSISQN